MNTREALALAYKILAESNCLTYRSRAGEDLCADTCSECLEQAVEMSPDYIKHRPDCEVGRLMAFMRDAVAKVNRHA